MELSSILPFSNKENIRSLALTILIEESPLKIFEIVNLIRKRYGKKVSFQAVSKELVFLVKKEIIIKKDRDFLINPGWARKLKENSDNIYEKIILKKKIKKDNLEEITIVNFDSLKEMMDHYYKLIDKWFDNFKKGDYNINCFQGMHLWEVLLNLSQEEKTMGQLKKKGIRPYLLTGSTKLDKEIIKLYKKIGAKAKSMDSKSIFDKSNTFGTYGDLIVQVKYPEHTIKKIDSFFKKNTSLDSYKLSELLEIVKEKNKVKMTIIKNKEMAKQINKSIISNFK